MSHSSVIVIGSGSAGLTAGLYTARANLKPLVFEGREPGGQLTWTTSVENFPGFPDGVMGPELMENMRKQAQKFGADCRFETVTSVDLSRRPFQVQTSDDPRDPEAASHAYTADALIVATGASARTLGLDREMHFMGYGLGTCATCDGALYRGKSVGVVGGGDTAVEEATFLTRFASRVTLIHRRHELRASKVMQDRIFANPKIDYLWNSEVDSYEGIDAPYRALTGLKLRSLTDASVREVPFDGVFLAIGHSPNTAILKGSLEMTPEGYVLTRNALAWKDTPAPPGLIDRLPNYGSATSIEGVFAAGDVVDTHYRQAITAAGSGCAAAIDCEKWLEAHGSGH
ncbi:MAG: thioredoxin-disulfide reductase [Isosphaeraceae bacterium]